MRSVIKNSIGKSMLFDMFVNACRVVGVFLLLIMFSCDDQEGEGVGPELVLITEAGLISSDTVISPGQLMNFGVVANKGDFNITEFLIKVKGETVQTWFDTGMYAPQLIWYGSFVKSYTDNEGWDFIVRDRYGHQQMTSIIIGVDSSNGPGPIDYFPNILMGAQNNPDEKGFLNLRENKLYFQQEAKENQELIDIIYYLGEDEHTLGSPGANVEDGIFDPDYTPTTWDIRNTSRYIPISMSVDEFDLIENDSILLLSYTEGEGKRKAKNLQADKVFSFKTQNLKFGIIKVNEVIGLDEGTVSIDIKIQKGEMK